MTDRYDDLIAPARRPGRVTWAALAVEADAARRTTRARTVATELERAGAPEQDRAAIEDALAADPGVGAPARRHVVAADGAIVHDEVFAGSRGPDEFGSGAVLDLLPLLRDRADDVAYLVVEADREGGELRLCRARRAEPDEREHVQGWEDHLNKVPTGGWSSASHQEHTEENWRQNQAMLAEEVDRVVREHRPRFVLLAGDVRAEELLEERLAPASRELVVAVGAHTGAPGASPAALDDGLEAALERVTDGERRRVADAVAREHGDRGARGLGAVAHALRAAEADAVLLEPGRAAERTAFALASEPWIALAPEEALGADVLDEVPAPVAVVRAALLTGAEVVFDDGDDPVDESGIAAALRWSPGPPVPGR